MKIRSLAIVVLALFLQKTLCKAQSVTLRDTGVVIELNLKAWDVLSSDLEQSRAYALKAIRIANELNYSRGLSYSFNIVGHYYKEKGFDDSSLLYYNKSLKIRERLRDTLNIARSYRNIMFIKDRMGKQEKAIETGLLAIQLLESEKSSSNILQERASIQNALGFIYFNSGNVEQAISLIHQAKRIFVRLKDENGLAAVGINLGNIYGFQKLYAKALAEYNTVIPILIRADNQEELARAYNDLGNIYYYTKNYGQAFFYYRKSYAIRTKCGFASAMDGSLMNLGIMYETFGKSDSADWCYKQALEMASLSGDKRSEYEIHSALGTLLYDQKKYTQALNHLLIAEHMAPGEPISAENSNLLREISKVYGALGNSDSALFYSNQYTSINDSLNEVLRKSIELEAAYKEKAQELKISEQNALLVQEKAKSQSVILITVIFFLLIIFFLYYLIVRSRRRMQELKEVVKDKELRALDAMLEGQQEERKRLATELHDTIGSTLAATKYLFKGMEKSIEKLLEENKGQYRKINTMLDETMESVRRISHNMASGIFTEKGMEGALADLSQTFEQAGKMRIHLNVYGFDQFPEYNTEVNLYRIVQELLTNIMKHAQAREVTIQLIKSSENINLTVEDDGKGFNPVEARRKKGIGLSNIELRVKRLSGKWNIDSGKGRGTTVIIDIPVKNNEAQRK